MSVRVARKLRSNLTEAERRLWSRLRRKQIDGHRFRRQAPVGPYVVDFLCFEARLIIEVDGGQHNEQLEKDAARTKILEAQGYRLLRFWNNDGLKNTDGVIEMIHTALKNSPSPLVGEGWGGGSRGNGYPPPARCRSRPPPQGGR